MGVHEYHIVMCCFRAGLHFVASLPAFHQSGHTFLLLSHHFSLPTFLLLFLALSKLSLSLIDPVGQSYPELGLLKARQRPLHFHNLS